MSAAGPSETSAAIAIVNGHEVSLFPSSGSNAPRDASQTNWLIVKFDRFVDYPFKQELRQENLEVYEHYGENSYLCKYTPSDLTPISNLDAVSHLSLYPETAVPMADIDGVTLDIPPTNGEEDSTQAQTYTENTKMPFVLALHPNPNDTPEQVLEIVQSSFGAEHLDDQIFGDTIRVKLDPALIPQISSIDSIRAIASIRERVLCSIRQRDIMQFSEDAISKAYKGYGETVFYADTGFDQGFTDDAKVHPAFKGRVLAAVTAAGATSAADEDGHGTHVAGSILGDLNQPPGDDMSNLQGTAPRAKLISIALNFAVFPPTPSTLALLTQNVPNFGQPVIMNNSWATGFNWIQRPYGPDDAEMVDKVMYQSSRVCLVFSAGNEGVKVSDRGQRQIGGVASAKNSITVGASFSNRPLDIVEEAYEPGGTIHSTKELAILSSTGPTVEGRLAPNVVAPGAVVLSARSKSISEENLKKYIGYYGTPEYNNLLFWSGTSMSAAAVTGCVAVLRSAFLENRPGKTPTGALLKALIVHGAVDLVGTKFTVVSWAKDGPIPPPRETYEMTRAPNPFQGYGRVDINNSLFPIIGPITERRGFTELLLPTGAGQKIYTMTIPDMAKSLTVTLAYTDLPGAALQNIITLSVKLPDGKTTLDPLKPTDPMNRGLYFGPSNVAKIFMNSPPPGKAHIYVDILTSQPTASFAVVWTIIP